MTKQLMHDAIDAGLTFLSGLVPGALGAAISLSYEKSLTWSQGFFQLTVGIIVSYFASGALVAVFSPAPFVAQGFSFTVGMIAYKATPKFIASAVEAVSAIPGAIRDRVGLGPKK